MEVEIAWAAIPLAEFLLRVATTLWNLGNRGIRLRNKECYRSDYPERPRREEYPGRHRLRTKNAGNGKGCDFGYALAIGSCERAHSVEACTVTALDAITAFAVPNPNYPSQGRRFFQVWLLIGSPRRADHSAYFGLAKFYLSQPFQPSTRVTLEISSTIVNAPFRCNHPLAWEHQAETQSVESLLLNELHFKFLSAFAQIVHRCSKVGGGSIGTD
jgi:hypothetical protein